MLKNAFCLKEHKKAKNAKKSIFLIFWKFYVNNWKRSKADIEKFQKRFWNVSVYIFSLHAVCEIPLNKGSFCKSKGVSPISPRKNRNSWSATQKTYSRPNLVVAGKKTTHHRILTGVIVISGILIFWDISTYWGPRKLKTRFLK